ncbi:MAG: thiamine-phosphate kinase [Gemmatimonadota bacterium]
MTDDPASRAGEFERIARLVEALGGAEGVSGSAIGDDAAVVPGTDGRWVWTVDAHVEGVHFLFDWLDPEEVGHRALAAAASDLAAMAADPVGALVSAVVTGEGAERLERVYAGMGTLAERIGCPVLGGDLARSEGPLHLVTTALGRCASGPPIRRSGARPGDLVWLTGELGGPAGALAWLSRETEPLAGDDPARRRLARPVPRVAEASWLRSRAPISAAIDLSDGLSGDAAHVAGRSGVCLRLEPAAIPIHAGARRIAEALGEDPMAWALHGGEEFELLVCAAPGALEPVAGPFAEQFGLPLTRIGEVVEGEGVRVVDGKGERRLEPRSWDHFRTSP